MNSDILSGMGARINEKKVFSKFRLKDMLESFFSQNLHRKNLFRGLSAKFWSKGWKYEINQNVPSFWKLGRKKKPLEEGKKSTYKASLKIISFYFKRPCFPFLLKTKVISNFWQVKFQRFFQTWYKCETRID